MFVLLHFQGHIFCHTRTAGPQYTFKGQACHGGGSVINGAYPGWFFKIGKLAPP